MLTKSQKIYLFFKRLIDIFGSTIGLLILSPLMIILTILTKLTSRGPVFFRQKRLGKSEKPFTLLKFRSMRVDAEQLGQEKISDVDRENMVTSWGKFIRKTSLDELPQLFNIFVGRMSFIGPRPEMAENDELLHRNRLSFFPNAYRVKPGLSGYSQIYLRRNPDPIIKSRADSWYVQHLSFWLDFKIFVWSFLCLFGYEKGR
jgi:lipopolysaccharide/colanic/teichoic acid biosynthesis glycosyltransferase